MKREYVYCPRCNTDINWDEDDPNDEEYGGSIDKLIHHWEQIDCIREYKLKQLLEKSI
jgi:hypothetical protein